MENWYGFASCFEIVIVVCCLLLIANERKLMRVERKIRIEIRKFKNRCRRDKI